MSPTYYTRAKGARPGTTGRRDDGTTGRDGGSGIDGIERAMWSWW